MEEGKNVVYFTQFAKRIFQEELSARTQRENVDGHQNSSKQLKSKCVFKRHLGGKQRHCCKWTEKCFGRKCYDLRKKCHWVGKIVTKAKTNGCRWVVIGRNIRRLRCCIGTRICVGKKCHRKNKKCRFTSLPIKQDWITKCKWLKGKNEDALKCCRHFIRCIGTKCKKSRHSCKFVQRVEKKRKTACYWRQFKKGRRQRCCSFSIFCKTNKTKRKVCKRLFRKCKWVGKTFWWTSKQICNWRNKRKNVKQMRCCKVFFKMHKQKM